MLLILDEFSFSLEFCYVKGKFISFYHKLQLGWLASRACCLASVRKAWFATFGGQPCSYLAGSEATLPARCSFERCWFALRAASFFADGSFIQLPLRKELSTQKSLIAFGKLFCSARLSSLLLVVRPAGWLSQGHGPQRAWLASFACQLFACPWLTSWPVQLGNAERCLGPRGPWAPSSSESDAEGILFTLQRAPKGPSYNLETLRVSYIVRARRARRYTRQWLRHCHYVRGLVPFGDKAPSVDEGRALRALPESYRWLQPSVFSLAKQARAKFYLKLRLSRIQRVNISLHLR